MLTILGAFGHRIPGAAGASSAPASQDGGGAAGGGGAAARVIAMPRMAARTPVSDAVAPIVGAPIVGARATAAARARAILSESSDSDVEIVGELAPNRDDDIVWEGNIGHLGAGAEVVRQRRRSALERNQRARTALQNATGGLAGDSGDVAVEIPHHLKCPISLTIMVDPVIACDGHTYERSSIEACFNYGTLVSPMTGAALDSPTLLPNHAIRGLCLEWKRVNQNHTATP